jgi:ABC-type nitrate/sulfonate/bicarbonate transport system substrate-binding protein
MSRADSSQAAGTGWHASPPAAALMAVVVLAVLVLAGSAFLAGGCGGSSPVPDKVTLQLNWYHEAEFVGYYVAEAKGFYGANKLDVTILEGGPGNPAREQVLNGAAAFAITSFAEQKDITSAKKPAVAVMAAFQIPPLVIFSLTESGIRVPADLVGKKVGVTTDYWKNVLHQTLLAAGVDPAKVTEVKVSTDDMAMLYDRRVDAWLGYAQDEPIRAEMAGYQVTNIFPADYGVGGYEGLVITSTSTVRDQPDMVARFVAASEQGWRYALEHPDEAASILDERAPGNGLDFQKLSVRALVPLVDIPQVPLGWIDSARWQQLMGAAYDPTDPGYTMQFSPSTP